MNKIYILVDNDMCLCKIIDESVLNNLVCDLRKLGFYNIVGIIFNQKYLQEKELFDEVIETNSVPNISDGILVRGNIFIKSLKLFELMIKKESFNNKNHKKTIQYHNYYGIMKNGRAIFDDHNEYKKTILEINNYYDLSIALSSLQKRINRRWMRKGVRLLNPSSIIISKNVVIGKESIIEQGSILKGNTTIGSGCIIGPYCEIKNSSIADDVSCSYSVIEDSKILKNSKIGPFVHLRNGTVIGEDNRIGNFVELKKSILGNKTNVAHLTYIGDTVCGDEVNWGCGSVTVNYDGLKKHKTTIGDKVFIGCNSNLIAPINIESNAFIAAGSTITNDIVKGGFAIARSKQTTKENYAKKYKFKE